MKYFLTLLIYRLVLILLLPFVVLLLLLRSIKQAQYRQRLLERLGLLPDTFKTGGIVVHAASVGEVIALKTFIENLLLAYPTLAITVTTFTPTGSEQVEKLFGQRVQHCYLPLDIMPCSALFLRRLQPKAMIFMETELWPNLIAQCSNHAIKLLLVNGRLSANSMKSYKKTSWLISPAINHFDNILVQSQHNLDNFRALGADVKRSAISGNIKFDISLSQAITDKKTELMQYIDPHRLIWLVASTHSGDEQLALLAFKQIRLTYPDLLLVIAPRHPERFDQISSLCTEQGYAQTRRSEKSSVKPDTQVWLLDSLGELMAAYCLADVVTIGGSFSNIGGHNPLEPALFKKPVIVGPDMANFNEIFTQLNQANALLQLPSDDENKKEIELRLADAVIHLLQQPEEAQNLGDNAYAVILANQGASKLSLQVLQRLLD